MKTGQLQKPLPHSSWKFTAMPASRILQNPLVQIYKRYTVILTKPTTLHCCAVHLGKQKPADNPCNELTISSP